MEGVVARRDGVDGMFCGEGQQFLSRVVIPQGPSLEMALWAEGIAMKHGVDWYEEMEGGRHVYICGSEKVEGFRAELRAAGFPVFLE
jgi:hypothetical protein